ncbi:hypothetical protein SAMN05660199_03966 [Klenkia soli]|uniref:Homeodomain-like domain-containing protein n=1 Tax=Klenkia soli TaxID=1052260 RepID=A0A1H0SY61_9ACTN|nr:hypothetical protein [Klenkia soli]SDP46747.1 hypothetical protein SAMN05660199_03966 [Klenkia soli]
MTDVLAELRAAAAVKRAARHRLADATAEHGPRSPELAQHHQAHDTAVERWVRLLLDAHETGHSTVVVARAAGVAPSSVHYRLQQAAASN